LSVCDYSGVTGARIFLGGTAWTKIYNRIHIVNILRRQQKWKRK